MNTEARIKEKLEAGLEPIRLEVADESHLHAGHSGARAGGETHYRIKVASARFSGKGRVERHRMVYALLADEIAGGVHALALQTLAPSET
ncbi:BolA family transcriptional regulator [Methylocapsa sp. S129]|uniref:BolA family protein n=1 Tax=Methylocapsa sp. S129 TaxID=1641869 RepID=UPI00131E493E|nr:BolA family protein [Methylocapsa sp. S129]